MNINENTTLAFDRKTILLIVVAALGYFVDVYDLLLFSVVRTPSLIELGIQSKDSLEVGLQLLNWQMCGLLMGAVFWGILGDKKGRLSVLFGSILIYSVANLLNAWVQDIYQYEWLRLLAGFGLAGELGAGITMVIEVVPKDKRGIGTTIIGSFGLLGAAWASVVGLNLGWRAAFIVGGVMGLCLLLLRFKVAESNLFEKLLKDEPRLSRGDLTLLFKHPKRFSNFARCILVGLPVYFVVGLLITGAPEFGKALGVQPIPQAGVAVMIAYIGMSVGDVACGLLSQFLKSRRKALIAFAFLSGVTISIFLFVPTADLTLFYLKCALAGFGVGYWALINTNTAEHFGTNLRSTVATLSPNLIRASLIPIAAMFGTLKGSFGILPAATIIGALCVVISIASTYSLEETFGKDLEYTEE
jgi:MFS transporter, putative metabolite:H+ symporter